MRGSYRAWFYKKHIEDFEGVGIERDLAGIPVLIGPPGVDLMADDEKSKQALSAAKALVRNIKQDKNHGVVMNNGWSLELLSSKSTRAFDTSTIINRYDQRIAITMLADIVMLGADKVGSFALANVKKGLLGAALDAQVKMIASQFNKKAIPQLLSLNTFPGMGGMPELVPTQINSPDLEILGTFLKNLKLGGINIAGEEIVGYLRTAAGLPNTDPIGVDIMTPATKDEEKQASNTDDKKSDEE